MTEDLSRTDLFRSLPSASLDAVADLARHEVIPPNTLLLDPRDRPRHLHAILQGRVEAIASDQGTEEWPVFSLGAGNAAPLAALVDPPTLPIPYKLRAATELETLAFPCEPLLDMARSDPGTGGILYRNALALSSRRWGQALQQYRCHFLMLLEARDLQASKELRTIRQQLLQSSRLAVLGGLLSSVAHEVKNPLTGILGFTQLLLRRDLGQEMRRDVTIIQQEAERISHIVHSMLSFSRKREPARNPVCLNETIERTLALQEYRLRVTNIQVVKDLQANLPLVLADYHQLQQVFLNLILNAQQAMTDAHGGGTLIMQTRQAGTHLRAIVADDGVGIPSEYTDRIFDPFFTTKGEGKGTGLGLSLCQAIVQEHGGSIRVESQPGQGSKFILELPLAAQSDALVAVSA